MELLLHAQIHLLPNILQRADLIPLETMLDLGLCCIMVIDFKTF